MLPIGNIQLGKTSKRSRYYPISVKSSVCLLSLICSSALYSAPAHAVDADILPQNGQVVGGDASFDYSTPSELHVQQNTDRVVINWDSFNIGQNALTEFHQPNSSSLAVNRVTGVGQDSTQILGMLKANGNVMVLDRNGVLFGQNSTVDVGGLIVTTGEIDTNAVMAGGSTLEITNIGTDSQIINEGQINISDAGLAAFVAPQIINNGIIQAKTGRVQIGAANSATIDLYGDGLLELAVDAGLEDALIENNGQIIADGGTVHISAVAAKDVVDNVINIDGIITVSSATQVGGKIILEGANTHISGSLHADGMTGGGEIYVGGGLKGQGPIHHADMVTLTTDAVVTANATDNGDGGDIILWSDSHTDAAGVFEAKGGVNGGDGGFIETSSKGRLHVEEHTIVDISAAQGDGGEWLLDPEDILIADVGGDVSTASINATLNGGGDVTITTAAGPAGSGNITLSAANIDKSVANSDATLSLQAINDIIMTNSSIDSSSGDALNVVFNSDRDADQAGGVYLTSSTITTSGGYFVAGGGAGTVDSDTNGILGDAGTGADMVAAYGTSANDDNGVNVNNTDINTGAGTIIMTGHALDDINQDDNNGIYVSNGATLTTASGQIILRGTGGAGNNSNTGVTVINAGTKISSATGDIEITGTGGTDVNADGNQNHGVNLEGGVVIESTGTGAGAATITITGTGAASEDLNRGVRIVSATTRVTSVDGDITITGTGGSNGAATSSQNYGLIVYESTIESTGTGVNAAAITLDGTGGAGDDYNTGVYIDGNGSNADITSVDGDISITGTGGSNVLASSSYNHGIYVTGGGRITSTGTSGNAATITLNGTGGAGDDYNTGVTISNAATLITSVNGDVNITGTGGSNGLAGSNYGEGVLVSSATISSTGTGASAAKIDIMGTGGAGEDWNRGVTLSWATLSSEDGDITVVGNAGSNGAAGSNNNHGVQTANANISSTGGGVNAAKITITGTGGNGEDWNRGIALWSSSTITSTDGDILLTGTGGSNGLTGSNNNEGLHIDGSPVIRSQGTGPDAATITIIGTGGNGEDSNVGVLVNAASTLLTSIDGDISITGTGGSNGAANSNSNRGAQVSNGAIIESTGTTGDAATITLDGTGGNGDNANNGVYITGAGSRITSAYGAIDITGLGRGFGDNNFGALITNSALIDSTGAGASAATITLDGTGGAGNENNGGVRIEAASDITSIDGDIDITGTGQGNGTSVEGFLLYNSASLSSAGNADITVKGQLSGPGTGSDIRVLTGVNTIGGGATTGNISLLGDTLVLSELNVQTTQNITVAPNTTTTTIGLGGGAGTLNLTDAELGLFNAGGTLAIGLSGTGTGGVDVDSWDLSAKAHDVEIYGGVTDIAGVTMGTGSFMAFAQSNAYSALTLSGAITRNAAGTASVDLRADGGIFLTAGDDITGTNGALNITLNANRNDDAQGLIAVTGATLDSNGGDIILGGGTDPLNTPTHDFRGISLTTATLTADAGDISIRGKAKSGGNYWQGAVIQGNSLIETTSGNITIAGEATTTGDNSPGLRIDSTTIQTVSGDVSLTGIAQQNNTNNYGTQLNTVNINITGSGDLSMHGESQIEDIITNAAVNIGSGTATGDFTFTTDEFTFGGGSIETDGDLTITPRTASTTIGIGGGVGDLNLSDAELALLDVGGTLTIGDSAAGTGDVDLDSWDLSSTTHNTEIYGGDIDLGGITMGAGSLLAHARDGADAADITLSAAITRNQATNAVLDLRADQNIIATAGGDITESGAGTLDIILNADRDADQDGSIKLDGVALSSNGGDITLGGGVAPSTTAAWGSSSVDDDGVDLNNTDLISGAGDIRLTGHGYDDPGNVFNMGIVLSTGSTLQTTSGSITLNGTGGTGSHDNSGINIANASLIQSTAGGAISLTGVGQGSGDRNYGVYLQDGSDIIANGSATLSVSGTGSNGSSINHGAFFEDSGTTVTNTLGAIDIDGSAQNGQAIYVNNGAIIESLNAGAADMTIDGTSSGGSGVNVSNANASIRTNGANMIVNAISTGSGNGLRIRGTGSTGNKPSIRTSGAGNLTITATSTSGTGLNMNEFSTLSSDGTGDFTLNVSGNRAIYTRRADILANDGDLNITATAAGFESWYTDKQVNIRANNGDLNFTGNRQIRFINGSTLRATNGDLTITASDIQVTGGTPTIRAGNTLSIKPYDVNSTIGLGGGSGTLNLSASELLNNLYASTLIIGDSTNGAGAVDINPVDLSAESFDLEIYGGSIVADGLDAANSLLLVANGGGAITLDGAISATGAGNSVVLVGDSFTNNAGAAAINAGTGRFLVYANQFSDVTDGGLAAGNFYGTTYAATPPASVAPTGSRFIFQEQPTLTFTADNATQTGNTPPAFTYSISGLRGSDPLGDALSGAPVFTQGAPLGSNTFSIDGAVGTATSLLGYLFNFTPGLLTVNNTIISDNSLDHQVQILTNNTLETQDNINISPFEQTLDSIVEIIYEDYPLSQEGFNTIKPSSGNQNTSDGQSGCLITGNDGDGCSSGQS